MLERTWYCVIRYETYVLLYIGHDPNVAAAAAGENGFLAEASTLGEVQRLAAMGAAKITQERKQERRSRFEGW